jgi:hypothetical protein
MLVSDFSVGYKSSDYLLGQFGNDEGEIEALNKAFRDLRIEFRRPMS